MDVWVSIKVVGLLAVVALIAVAVVHDLWTREIPDWVPIAIGSIGLALLALVPWPAGVISAMLGLLVGSAAGMAMFWTGGFGGADAKLLAVLGLVLGFQGAILMLLVMAIAGGVLALIARVRGQAAFAYGPAIGLGAVTQIVLELGANS